MRPRGQLTRYDAMLGYLVRLRRDDRVPWPKALAWTIAAYRTRFPSESAYLHLARQLERDARDRLAQAARDRARQRRRPPAPGLTLPPAAHLRIEARPSAADAIRAEWLAKHTGGASMRARPLPARTEPAPISARLIRPADSQPAPPPPAWSETIAEDAAMPPIEALADQVLDAEPGHLLQPDAVAELAEALNKRRL